MRPNNNAELGRGHLLLDKLSDAHVVQHESESGGRHTEHEENRGRPHGSIAGAAGSRKGCGGGGGASAGEEPGELVGYGGRPRAAQAEAAAHEGEGGDPSETERSTCSRTRIRTAVSRLPFLGRAERAHSCPDVTLVARPTLGRTN